MRRNSAACLTVLALVVVSTQPLQSREVPVPATGRIDVLFSPRGGCQSRIIDEIGRAKTSVHVQACSLTNPAIALAIIDAMKRGVECEVILDKSDLEDEYSASPLLHREGVRILIDSGHTANNRIIIIDNSTVMTGSYSLTKASEETDAENLLILKDVPDITRQYMENYQLHQAHSEEYVRPQTAPRAPQEAAAPVPPAPPPAAPSAAQAPAPSGADNITVYVTKSGTKYHREGCQHLRTGGTPIKLSEARARYGPCSRCKAPE
jgi:phosphatidylserine/phosphatidylglycerophosphate/cardiolipin synthase-like enzyme